MSFAPAARQYEKPVGAGCSTYSTFAGARCHDAVFSKTVGTPVALYASVANEKSFSVSGPFSVSSPMSELPPGPPCCQTTVGASARPAAFSTSQ